MNLSTPQRHLLSRWNRVAVPAAWLMASFAFVLSFSVRMSATSAGPQAVVGLSGIVIAVVVAVLQPILQARPNTVRSARHGLWAGVFLGTFLAGWVAFDALLEAWTCPYAQQTRLVVGTTPTTLLESYIKQSPAERSGHSGACRMVKEYAGAILDMYEHRGVAVRYYALVGLHLLAWLSLAGVVVSTVDLLTRTASRVRRREEPLETDGT